MGISYLTKHLLPYAETVSLGGCADQDEPPRVQAVIIDGPSLVYHVYHRLLASTDPSCDVLDVQPTCDEVSRGVVSCLLQVARLDVEICNIYFDGALPVSKRDTRLARFESSRQRLEVARRRYVVSGRHEYRTQISTRPLQLWRSRGLAAQRRSLPENPFMVSSVFEDLKHRWSKKRVEEEFHYPTHPLPCPEYPWADITLMVPGEADIQCAQTARLTGTAILTDDSDLLVHDLGPDGAVVLLSSLHMLEDVQPAAEPEIRGLRIHPHQVSRRLGVANIQRLAYTLTRNPRLSFVELLRRAKEEFEAIERSSDYSGFLREYQIDIDVFKSTWIRPYAQELDPRVSELLWQYEMPDTYCQNGEPHLYLGIIHEDHSRRCAWEQGRLYRAVGYSLLNLSQESVHRFPAVNEFVRRGGRIVAERVALSGASTVASELSSIQKRLDLARTMFGSHAQPSFWVMFALSEIYRDTANATTAPDAAQLERFLGKGFMGKTTDWADIHLLAQIQAVLYSVRILKQLYDVAVNKKALVEHRVILTDLPPLYSLMKSRHEIVQIFSPNDIARRSVRELFKAYG